MKVLILCLLLLSACDTSRVDEKIHRFFFPGIAKLRALFLKSSPEAPTHLKQAAPGWTERRRKRNLEILNEMIEVVTLEPPQNEEEFLGWVSALEQGASLEGVYNGIIHSSQYRSLESGKKATSATLGEFILQWVKIHGKMPTDPSPYANASFFTLKRILGEALLVHIETLEETPLVLERWYGDWAASLATKMSFGLEKRNSTSHEFHENWAKSQSHDLLRWESLNRIHRILNGTTPKMKEPAKTH